MNEDSRTHDAPGAGPARGEAGEVRVLRERLSALCAASGRIGASLDLETALGEIADSARALTGARCSWVVTVDAEGRAGEFLARGAGAAERRRLEAWEDGPRLFAHLRDLPGPIRVADLPAYVSALGLDGEVLRGYRTFAGTAMRHCGEQVGGLWLVDKAGGGGFTDDDEELLVLFASLAAVAVANARAFHNERRARADLEALVDTSPVGVAVFEAATGRLVSLNREARRIVERLRAPGRSTEDLLEILVCRRADGRELALGEFPLAAALERAETVRAEEIVLSVPEGPCVRTLLSATPVCGEAGVETVVVTLQDLAPLEALERMRADFLAMVSHELRVPLSSVRGAAATVLGARRAYGAAELEQYFRIVDEQAERMSALIDDLLDAGAIDAGTLSVAPESSGVGALVDAARTAFLSGGTGHDVAVDLPDALPRVMADRARIAQVLGNLLANAARHSPPSAIRVAAELQGGHVEVSVADAGRGLDAQELARLFGKYAGRAPGSGPSGQGLGLAICKGIVEAHGGRIRAESAGPGTGTRVAFTLPVAEAAVAPVGFGAPAEDARARVLVVDDDPRTLRFAREALEDAGFDAMATANFADLERILEAERPALVLLDLMLPGSDGIELLAEVPGLTALPVIFISAYGRDETVARALDAGAEDYLVKPFSATELTARVRAALRRRAGPPAFVLGALAIDYRSRRVTLGGRALELTATEHDLLCALARNAGAVCAYEDLARTVWRQRKTVEPQLIRAFVRRLRAKLGEDAERPVYVLTERGVGYRMPAPTRA